MAATSVKGGGVVAGDMWTALWLAGLLCLGVDCQRRSRLPTKDDVHDVLGVKNIYVGFLNTTFPTYLKANSLVNTVYSSVSRIGLFAGGAALLGAGGEPLLFN